MVEIRTKFRLLGKTKTQTCRAHILRADEDDLGQVLLEYGSNVPKTCYVRRCGRPKMDWPIESMKDALPAPGRMVPIHANLLNIQIITCSKILLTKPTSNPRNSEKEPQETLQRCKCDPSLTATQRAVAIVGLCSAIHELNVGALVHAHHPSTGSPYRHGI